MATVRGVCLLIKSVGIPCETVFEKEGAEFLDLQPTLL